MTSDSDSAKITLNTDQLNLYSFVEEMFRQIATWNFGIHKCK